MSDILEQSLDDIIGQKKQQQSSSRRGGRFPSHRRDARRSRHHHHQQHQSHPYNRPQSSSSYRPSRKIPQQVLDLAHNRPTLRIKNIHSELNGEDLSNLFSSISPVDFVKFDDENDTVAYICFQDDCERNNVDAIAKFDGKKAMGKILIVENTVSLLDRIDPRSVNRGARPIRERGERGPRGGPRGGRRDHGRGGRERPSNHKKSAEELDAELNEYMGKTTESLDQQLDDYMGANKDDTKQPDEMNVD
ncbi:hypothetical protein SBY92_004514 [Candida maltosa Xu316]|uniref:Chromatin target of PRMT1 protein C-terminal domain-containing protein n=1 Tax=Candida maltosa (strain Xu316) TaxID=1245528 RepID=M3K4J2_CANMX|nr:hypothetical protein G210_5545 [Candida maltosa Xu316]